MKLVAGPARLTKSMSRRGLRSRFGFTGTGLAQPNTGSPAIAPIAGQDDRAERVDVRDRVQREPTGLLGGASPNQSATTPWLISCRMTATTRQPKKMSVCSSTVHGGAAVALSGAATRR